MLSTPIRKEINNDLRDVQERELKTYAQHSLYGGQHAMQETVYDRSFDMPFSASAAAPASKTSEQSQIARKLFGDSYAEYESEVAASRTKTHDYNNPDLMPSRATMRYPEFRSYYSDDKISTRTTTTSSAKTAVSSAANTRTKILIAGYVAIVLALVLIITLASVSVATLFGDISALEAQLDTEIARVNELNDELSFAESDANIIQRARIELGMEVPADWEINSFPAPATVDAPSVTADGNWFDGFTNWLSNLFS